MPRPAAAAVLWGVHSPQHERKQSPRNSLSCNSAILLSRTVHVFTDTVKLEG